MNSFNDTRKKMTKDDAKEFASNALMQSINISIKSILS